MSEAGPTPDKDLAKAIATGLYIYLVVILIGVVVQLVLCLYTLWNFRKKTCQWDETRVRLLCVSFAIWAFYSAAAMVDAWNIIVACSRGPAAAYPTWSLGASTGLTLAYIVMGDCLMFWRCWCLRYGPGWMVIAPTATFLASITFGVLSVVSSVTGKFSDLVGILWIASSVATNVLITSFIISKLLVARREVIKSEMYDRVPRFYRDMIVVLIESAAPLALAGLCTTIASAIRLSGTQSHSSVRGLYLFDLVSHVSFLLFAALSPQMILFRTLVIAPRGLRIADGSHSYDPGVSQSAQFSTIQYIP
ncbi:hypothetical protein BKA70DRAFT_1282966 [Coprinopsis sp. MPI-PUGE-AT-0042]|nr:hypothetical protein BKA70DRAFT_1282966 [Coprinopsis sp. MPI-PUGE-AT-0042]